MMATLNEVNLKVNVSYGDVSLSDENANNLTLFVLWGVLLPLVAAAGLIGNVLTMMVLWRKEMNSTTILYMRGLVITDSGILIGSVISLCPIALANYLNTQALTYFKDVIYPIIFAPSYYMVMLLQQINVWITVSVSVERYIAICYPFRAGQLITKRKTLAAMLGITMISIVYNIPHLFSTENISCAEVASAGNDKALGKNNSNNINSNNATSVATDTFEYSINNLIQDSSRLLVKVVSSPSPTESTVMSPSQKKQEEPNQSHGCFAVVNSAFGKTDSYVFFRTIMYMLVIYVLPFIALLILNTFLIRELMTMQRRQANRGSKEENEANLSLVLVLVVIVFIFCQTPGLISQFEIIPPSVFFTWLGVSNVLFATNSAVNFLIYTAFGKKFRLVLLRVFRRLSSTHVVGRRRASSACSFHEGLKHYASNVNGTDAVEMSPLPLKYHDTEQDNNLLSPQKVLMRQL